MLKKLTGIVLIAALLGTPGCNLRSGSGAVFQTIAAAFTSDLNAALKTATIAVTQEFVKMKDAPITVVVRERGTGVVVFQQEYSILEVAGTFSEVIPFVAEIGKKYDIAILMQGIQTPWKPL